MVLALWRPWRTDDAALDRLTWGEVTRGDVEAGRARAQAPFDLAEAEPEARRELHATGLVSRIELRTKSSRLRISSDTSKHQGARGSTRACAASTSSAANSSNERRRAGELTAYGHRFC